MARAEGVPVAADVIQRIESYVAAIPGTMRSSLLIDLSQGKRIEVEALHGCARPPRGAGRGRRADYGDAVRGAEAMGEPTRLRIAS